MRETYNVFRREKQQVKAYDSNIFHLHLTKGTNKTEYGDNMKSLIGGLEHEFYDFPFILGIS